MNRTKSFPAQPVTIALAFGLVSAAAFAQTAAPSRIEAKLLEMADDPDLRVRFQLAFTLGELDASERTQALTEIALSDASDRWVRTAILSSVGDIEIRFFEAFLGRWGEIAATQPEIEKNEGASLLLGELARTVGIQASPGKVEALASLLADLDSARLDWVRAPTLRGLARGLKTAEAPAIDRPGLERALAKLTASGSEKSRSAARQISPWVASSHVVLDLELVEGILDVARDPNRDEAERVDSIAGLRKAKFEQVADALFVLMAPAEPEAIQIAVLETLGAMTDPNVGNFIMMRWPGFTQSVRTRALDVLFARIERLGFLIAALERGEAQAAKIEPHRRAQLAALPDDDLAARARAVFADMPSEDSAELYDRYRSALDLTGSAEAGGVIFRDRCSQCHRVGETGQSVGPEPSGFKDNAPDVILTNLLDPNREIKPGFTDYVVETTGGRVITGIVVSSGATSLTLRRGGGEEDTVLRRNIASMRDTSISIMPEGLAQDLSIRDMADLLAFIAAIE